MSKLLEAYPEGADLFLVCEVHGGECQPWLFTPVRLTIRSTSGVILQNATSFRFYSHVYVHYRSEISD